MATQGMIGYSERKPPVRIGSCRMACSGTGSIETSSSGCSASTASAAGSSTRVGSRRANASTIRLAPMQLSTTNE